MNVYFLFFLFFFIYLSHIHFNVDSYFILMFFFFFEFLLFSLLFFISYETYDYFIGFFSVKHLELPLWKCAIYINLPFILFYFILFYLFSP